MNTRLLCLLLSLLSTTSGASNLQREQQIADEVINNLSHGESVWLGDQTSPFLALHLQSSTPKTLGGAILLHDMDANPDKVDVIQPLRTNLADQGWETLSIQLPVASQDAERKEYRRLIARAIPRIQAAVDFYTSKQNRNLVLIGHGLGAEMGLTFLDTPAAVEIRAFVAIGLTGGNLTGNDNQLESIGRLNIPMLDLIGSRELDFVKHNAQLRRLAAKRAGRAKYRLDNVSGADHNFTGLNNSLQGQVGAWLRKVAAGMEIDGAGTANPPPSVP